MSQLVTVDTLPESIFFLVKSYLKHYDYREFLVTSNSLHFRDVRRKTIYMNLKEELSVKYCTHKRFRNKVLSLICNKRKQLALQFYERELPLSFLEHFHDIHKLKITPLSDKFQNFSSFKNIHRLILSNSFGIEDCHGLENICELEVYSFERLGKAFLGVHSVSALFSFVSLVSLLFLSLSRFLLSPSLMSSFFPPLPSHR
jgi:hypothetical protein